ncbi:MAG TPA: class I SAM-dependent methyltransferase [Methylocystis sp.]
MTNIDQNTVESFGAEWSRFAQHELDDVELLELFDAYFHIFPWQELPQRAEGFDMGCGSGRWAKLVAPRVGKLNCVDPSAMALGVTRRNLEGFGNVNLINAGVSDCPIVAGSQDFGYSLGVLHHIPDTTAAMKDCVKLLKPGAPFLVYLYYRFDNRPPWYSAIWKISNVLRLIISRMADRTKSITTDIIAALIYFPLARIALLGEWFGLKVDSWLLSSYRGYSFYTMRTDSRDRFGTPLEQRFTRREIEAMMVDSGLEKVIFSERFPFWCAVGRKKR